MSICLLVGEEHAGCPHGGWPASPGVVGRPAGRWRATCLGRRQAGSCHGTWPSTRRTWGSVRDTSIYGNFQNWMHLHLPQCHHQHPHQVHHCPLLLRQVRNCLHRRWRDQEGRSNMIQRFKAQEVSGSYKKVLDGLRRFKVFQKASRSHKDIPKFSMLQRCSVMFQAPNVTR